MRERPATAKEVLDAFYSLCQEYSLLQIEKFYRNDSSWTWFMTESKRQKNQRKKSLA